MTAPPFEINSWRDITPLHVSLGHVRHNRTGSWRFIKPVFEDKLPPCQNRCPAGNDIEGWVSRLQRKDYTGAYWHLKNEQPFPAILGRVCLKLCQSACNRAAFDQGVRINELERFVGDQVPAHLPIAGLPAYHGQSLAVIGSGPAGMACAFFARRLGFRVTIYEQETVPGGLLRLGIPAYRLPRDIVAAEFEGLTNMGVVLHTGIRVGRDLSLDMLRKAFDYIFVAVGLPLSRPLGLEDEARGVMSGLDFLKKAALGDPPALGKRVVVVGGGNTAIDAARSALRRGAEVTVLYRRSRFEMPAHAEEIEQAVAEGVAFEFLAGPKRLLRNAEGSLRGVLCSRMAMGEEDIDGRRQAVEVVGDGFEITADTLISAIGETADPHGLVRDLGHSGGVIPITSEMAVADQAAFGARIYAAGDITGAERTVIHAVAAGKQAAIAMDCRRRGLDFTAVRESIGVGNGPALRFGGYLALDSGSGLQNCRQVVTAGDMVFDYFEKTEPVVARLRPAEDRRHTFTPVRETLNAEQADREAARCLHCGRCTQCDNCLVFCPDLSVRPRPEGRGYHIDYDYCKGCGICANECPRKAITMLNEVQAASREV